MTAPPERRCVAIAEGERVFHMRVAAQAELRAASGPGR